MTRLIVALIIPLVLTRTADIACHLAAVGAVLRVYQENETVETDKAIDVLSNPDSTSCIFQYRWTYHVPE